MFIRSLLLRHNCCKPIRKTMASSTPLSYSAALSGNTSSSQAPPSAPTHPPQRQRPPAQERDGTTARPKRSPSPAHRPHTSNQHDNVYVLTLLTDKPHHDRMTRLRTRYFPRHLNKLDAHLTLFHALPASHLQDSVIPVLEFVARETAPFTVRATRPFRLKKGIAIAVAKTQGVAQADAVHRALLEPWFKSGFLSEQDQGACRVHYTIMNKVDDEREVSRAFEEVSREFGGGEEVGIAVGLGLWRYERGWWRWERGFEFGEGGEGGWS